MQLLSYPGRIHQPSQIKIESIRETRMMDQLKKKYDENGVIHVPEFLSAKDVSEIREELERYIHEDLRGKPADAATREADGEQVRNLWRLEEHNPCLRKFAERADLLQLVRTLLNGEPVLAAIETFNKPAKVGSGVPPHQDNAYFCRTPADMLTIWIAIDPVTNENGPVTYIKGSHLNGVLPTKPSGVKGNSIGLAEEVATAPEAEFCGILAPGDATIHHCNTIHWSAPNTTDSPRLGFLMVYRGAHTEVDQALRETYVAASTINSPS